MVPEVRRLGAPSVYQLLWCTRHSYQAPSKTSDSSSAGKEVQILILRGLVMRSPLGLRIARSMTVVSATTRIPVQIAHMSMPLARTAHCRIFERATLVCLSLAIYQKRCILTMKL